ncbi:MAG: hypothetical protein JSW41_01650, partial [Candidatus Aenigmatarchaeota archaeon]
MVKKGFSIIPAVLILLIAAAAIYSASLTWKWGEAIEKRSDVVFHSYSMNNALDLARLYMDVSLDYSAYQACYETLKDLDPSISEDEFKQKLESSIKEKLNVYTRSDYRFLIDYKVSIFEYDSVTIEGLNPLKVKATGKDMFIRVEDSIRKIDLTMEKDPTLDKTVPIDCYGMYQKGKEVNTEIKNTLESSIKEKIDSWPDTSKTLPDLNSLKAEIEAISELVFEKTEGSYTIKSEFTEASVEFEGYEKSGDEPY